MKAAMWLALLSAIALQLTRNKNWAHWMLTVTIVLLAATCAFVLLESRRDRAITGSRTLLTGIMTVLVILAATARLGVLSPMIGFLIVTVYYNSSGDAPFAGLLYALSAVGYALLAALSYAGFLPLTGAVLAMVEQNNRALLGFALVGEGLLLATHRMARQNRQAKLTAMDRLERAVRQLQQRDALLDEARAEIDGARAPTRGRLSGSAVGDYTLGNVIGRGATGEVYEAMRVEPAGAAAVKVLYPHLLDADHLARYLREGELTQRLDSPHLLRWLAHGSLPDGCPYVATELLVGRDLAEILREKRVLGLQAVVDMVAQVARGLNSAQEAGVVHRDLKPQNLFLAQAVGGGQVWKVLDFGVAALSTSANDITRGAAVGTPNYMSPEQTRGEIVDHRSDVFALGAIAYRALTGQPPFAAVDPVSTMYKVNYVQPAKPSELAQLPKDVDLALALALAKNKSQRFRSASTFAAALRDAARSELDEPFRRAAAELLVRHCWLQDSSDG